MVGLLGWRTLVNLMCPQVTVATHGGLTDLKSTEVLHVSLLDLLQLDCSNG